VPGIPRFFERIRHRTSTVQKCVLASLLTLATLVIVGVSNSCSTIPREVLVPPEVVGANYVGNKACFYCHTNYARAFPASPHAKVRLHTPHVASETSCESCHGAGSKHVEVGGGKGRFIVNPGKDPSTCFQCHIQTHAEFELPQHHPVIEGRMNCVQCHDPHGFDIMKPARGLAMSRLNESCAQCHREQSKPFVFEHEALREGCTTCHNPHGSVNAKLLIERDNNLCLKCHAQRQGALLGAGQIFIGDEDHTDKLMLGTCWSAGCHTAIHGSNFNPYQLY
jgi:predicted CXXCH cytochrome family protein